MADYSYSSDNDADDSTSTATSTAPRRDHDRPSYEDIKAMLEERRSRYSTLHGEMEIDQDWIYAAATNASNLLAPYISGFPKGFRMKILPLAEMGVNVATDAIMIGERPSVTVAFPTDLHKSKAAEKQHKNDIKEWCEGFLEQADTRAIESPFRDVVKKGFGLGAGHLSYAIQWDAIPKPPKEKKNTRKGKKAWAEYEHERAYCFPFDVKSIHPLSLFPDPNNDPPLDYIEETEVDLRSICQKYPHLLDQKPEWAQKLRPSASEAGASNAVKRVTYVSKKYFAQYIDDVPLLIEGADEDGVADNPSGYLWIRTAYSGFGEQDDKGRLEYRVRGIVRSARDSMAAIIADFNDTEVMRNIIAFPPLIFGHEDEAKAQQYRDEFRYGPAESLVTDGRLQLSLPPQPDVPQAVFQNAEIANQILQLLYGPDIQRGVHREDTAAGQRTRLRQAQMPYQTMKVAMEQAIAGMLTDILCAIRDEFDGPVTVWKKLKNGRNLALTLDPKRIPAKFHISIDLSPPTEEERDYLSKKGLELLERGLISEERYMTEFADANIEDPEAEMIERDAEMIIKLGPVQEWLANSAIEKTQQRLAAEQGTPPPAPMQGAPGPQPGMTGNQELPTPAADLSVGPGGFTLDGAQPAPQPLNSPGAMTAAEGAFVPYEQQPPPAPVRGV
jgi:hypothetical protein